MHILHLFTFCLAFLPSFLPVHGEHLAKRNRRTTPPAGAVIVRGNGTQPGEFSSVQAAVNSLDDKSQASIFIYPGTYTEQVTVSRSGPLKILGYTADTSDFQNNVVTIVHNLSAAQAGSDKASSTLIANSANFSLYNVNLRNTFGKGSQAIAVAAYGVQQGYYGVGLYGWQDTVYSNEGNHFFGKSYIEGAVDFIFGRSARAFFNQVVIGSVGAGCITADGPLTASVDSIFVIFNSTVKQGSSAATDLTSQVYLGRPWSQFARVAFLETKLSSIIKPAGWSVWNSSTPNTADVEFVEGFNTGPGASGTRASFATQVTSLSGFTPADILGSNWTAWVDQNYV